MGSARNIKKFCVFSFLLGYFVCLLFILRLEIIVVCTCLVMPNKRLTLTLKLVHVNVMFLSKLSDRSTQKLVKNCWVSLAYKQQTPNPLLSTRQKKQASRSQVSPINATGKHRPPVTMVTSRCHMPTHLSPTSDVHSTS